MRHVLLLCAATALLSTAALARQPSGEGDPAEVRCMRLEGRTGSLGGGTLCKPNADWARLKADGVVLDDSGNPIPPKDARDVGNHGCTTVGATGMGATRMECH